MMAVKIGAWFVALSGPLISVIGFVAWDSTTAIWVGQLVMLAGLVVFLAIPSRAP